MGKPESGIEPSSDSLTNTRVLVSAAEDALIKSVVEGSAERLSGKWAESPIRVPRSEQSGLETVLQKNGEKYFMYFKNTAKCATRSEKLSAINIAFTAELKQWFQEHTENTDFQSALQDNAELPLDVLQELSNPFLVNTSDFFEPIATQINTFEKAAENMLTDESVNTGRQGDLATFINQIKIAQENAIQQVSKR